MSMLSPGAAGAVPSRKWTGAAGLLFLAMGVGAVVYEVNIMLAVGAAVALGMLLVMFARPNATTLMVIFAMYANLAVVAIRYHHVPQLVGVCFFLLLGIPLLNYVVIRREPLLANPVLLVMLTYFVVMLASAVLSKDARQSTGRIASYVLEGVVLYFLILNTVRTPGALRKAVWALVLAGCLMGSFSLYQEATRSYDKTFGGLAQIETEEIGTGQTDFGGKAVLRPRLAGPIGETNRYAQIMLVLLPLAALCALSERSLVLRVLGAAACVPILGGILLTFSRGAALSVLLLLLVMVFLKYIKIRYALAGLLALVLVMAVAEPSYVHRISTLAGLSSGSITSADTSIRGRAAENLAAAQIFLENPFLGAGAGQAHLYIAHYANETGLKMIEGTRRGHNMYLEELADTGIVGFAFFVSIVALTIRRLMLARRRWILRRPDYAHTATGLLLAIVAYLSSAMFLQLAYVRYYWLLLALAGVGIRVFDEDFESGSLAPGIAAHESGASE